MESEHWIETTMRKFGNSEFSTKPTERNKNMISDFDLAVKELEKKERGLIGGTGDTEDGA